jgi:hypothetical protein
MQSFKATININYWIMHMQVQHGCNHGRTHIGAGCGTGYTQFLVTKCKFFKKYIFSGLVQHPILHNKFFISQL